MLLSVIIVNYNVKYFLELCLRSVERAIENISAEIIVIDNASTDGSIGYLSSRFPSVQFVSNKVNTGFGKANNQGLQLASGELVLFLNPDTIIPEDGLEKCISFLNASHEAGACGVRMIDGSGKYLPESKRGFPSLITAFFKLSGITARFPNSRRLARYYLGHLPEKEINEVDVLAGAYFMVKRKVLEVTGGFDEAFFMYGEDIDLSYRIQKAGWKNYYFPGTTIIHFKGESTKKGDLDYVHMFYKAMRIFVNKHYAGRGSGWFTLFIQVAITLRALPTTVKTIFKVKPLKSPVAVPHTAIICASPDADKIISKLNMLKTQRKFSIFAGIPPCEIFAEINELIFSESAISFKNIIEAMQKLPSHLVYRFYHPDTNVIIGSDSKNNSGIVIV